MKNVSVLKSLIIIMLVVAIIHSTIPLCHASINGTDTSSVNISDTEHKQTIEQFVDEIKALQSQVAAIALTALRNSSSDNSELQARIHLINASIQRLNRMLQDYLATTLPMSERNRHILLTFNVLNLVKSSLYSLNLLINTTDAAERFALLDEYFQSRVTAIDTIQILDDILLN